LQNLTTQKQWFHYIAKSQPAWPLVFYSPQRNVLINTICKNASSSIEGTVRDYEPMSDFHPVLFNEQQEIWIAEECPTVITVLRDPVSRLKSAIGMLRGQLRSFGLRVDETNFTNLEFTTDLHLVPQSAQVPTESECEHLTLEDLNFNDQYYPSRFKNGWIGALEEYDICSRYGREHKWFWLSESECYNVVQDILEFLGIADENYIACKANTIVERGETYPEFSDDYIRYVKTIYKSDYDLINIVNFVNDTPEKKQERINNVSI